MILNKNKSRNFLINLFADFIVDKIGKTTSTKIQVIDCINFFVIKGKTDSEKHINLLKLTSEFTELYKEQLGDVKLTHIIDLIEYECEMTEVKKLETTFHNSENCIYHQTQINEYLTNDVSTDYCQTLKTIEEDNLYYVSSFPHGFSLSQGRSMFYLLKNMFYSIPTNYITSSLTLTLDLTKNEDEILEVFNHHNQEYDESLKSAFLDYSNFDTSEICSKIEKLDWSTELINPTEDYTFLKEEKLGIIII